LLLGALLRGRALSPLLLCRRTLPSLLLSAAGRCRCCGTRLLALPTGLRAARRRAVRAAPSAVAANAAAAHGIAVPASAALAAPR
jgi:hypothetical protein